MFVYIFASTMYVVSQGEIVKLFQKSKIKGIENLKVVEE